MFEKKLNKFTYRSTIIIYLLLIAFFPVITLGYYAYHTYTEQITEKISMSTEATVNQTKSRVDALLVDIRKNYVQIVEEEEISWMLNNQIAYSDYSYLMDVINALQGNKYLIDYISGYTIINFDTEWILSNRGMFKYDLLTNKTEVEALREYNKGALGRYFWLDNMGQEEASKLKRETVNLQGLSLVLQVPMMKRDPHGLVIINVSEEKLWRVVEEIGTETGITILNKEGAVVYSDNEEIAAYCSQHIEDLLEKERTSIQLKDKTRYMLKVESSDAVNWIYVASSDMNIAREGASGIIGLMIILLTMVGLLLAGIKFFTYRIYTPILDLTQYVKKVLVKEQEGEDEFEYLTTSIDELVVKKNSLEGLLTNQKEQLTELFQRRLIDGDIKKQQIELYMQQLNIPKKSHYMIMSVNLEEVELLEQYDKVRQDAIQDAVRMDVIDKLPHAIRKELLMHPVYSSRAISIIIGNEDEKELKEQGNQLFNELSRYVGESYQLFIKCGVSAVFGELSSYEKAYHQSIEALKSQFMASDCYIEAQSALIYYTDITPAQEYSYDMLLEKQIKEAIESGEEQEAFELLEQFIDGLVEQCKIQSECQLYLHRLLSAILTVMSDAGISTAELFKEGHNVFLNLNQIYDMNKLKCFYKHKIIRPIISELKIYRASKSGNLLDAIKKLIKESNGDITLAECAEKLHYHTSYIWKVMKLEGERTFSDFVAEYKLLEAKRLLNETSLTVAEIAQKLGYTNTQNFIRFFSKVEGVTPGKYRKGNESGHLNNHYIS